MDGQAEPVPNTVVPDVGQSSITDQYFRVMGVPLERGRLFSDQDNPRREAVAIVNEALAHRYFSSENPIGRRIKIGDPGTDRPWLTIVGVVGVEKDKNFFDEMNWDDIPMVFRPISQDSPAGSTLVVRTERSEGELSRPLQRQISSLDSGVPMGEPQTMAQKLNRTLAYPQFRAVLLSSFAGLAVLLASVGLYGVLSQLVAQRQQEFAVRMALGAQGRDVLALVVKEGLLLTGAGLAGGLIITLWLTHFLSSLLYGVQPTDPWTLTGASLLLLLVALGSTLIPATRASKIDSIGALKYE